MEYIINLPVTYVYPIEFGKTKFELSDQKEASIASKYYKCWH